MALNGLLIKRLCYTDNERLLRGCEHQTRKTIHSLLGVQQWRGRLSRLVLQELV